MTRHPDDLALHFETVRPQWIDYNGHMNLAYYLLVFDQATDVLCDRLDLGLAYRNRENCSLFAVETHLTYQREVVEGDGLSVSTRVLGYDRKRLHLFHQMHHVASSEPVATNELMMLHVDMKDRKTTEFQPLTLRRIEPIFSYQQQFDRPAQAGRAITSVPPSNRK